MATSIPHRVTNLLAGRRGIIIVLILVGTALYLLSERWETPRSAVATGQLAGGLQDGRLLVQVWMPTNRVVYGERTIVWVSFENRAAEPISGLHFIDVQFPGLVEVGRCWQDHAPACPGERPSDTPVTPLPTMLAGRGLVVVSAELSPAARSGRYAPVIVVGWRTDDSGPHRNAISCRPIELTSVWHERFLFLVRHLHVAVKDVALPLVLVLVAYGLQQLSSEHAERNQVWQSFLGQSLADAQKYYMPIVSRVRRFQRRFPQATNGSLEAREECFYSLLSFLRQLRFMIDGIGSLQFKNRQGEIVAGLAWSRLRNEVECHFPFLELERVHRAMEPGEDFATFLEHFTQEQTERVQPFATLRQAFDAWLVSTTSPMGVLVPLIEILTIVMTVEINRPFEIWYGERDTFPKEDLETAGEALKEIPDTEELRAVLAKYVEAESGL